MTKPLPWTGAIRSMQEIEDHKPVMDKWFENQSRLSMRRISVAIRGDIRGLRNRKASNEALNRIFNGNYYHE